MYTIAIIILLKKAIVHVFAVISPEKQIMHLRWKVREMGMEKLPMPVRKGGSISLAASIALASVTQSISTHSFLILSMGTITMATQTTMLR